MINKSSINKILVISLTNIGDIILTFPVMDILREDFSQAELSVVVGPKGTPLLKDNPRITHLYEYNKRQSPMITIKWLRQMQGKQFDLIVDLRNSAVPFLVGARYKTSPFLKRFKDKHMIRQHLNRLRSVYPYPDKERNRFALCIPDEDQQYIRNIIDKEIGDQAKIIVVAPGAADRNKQWPEEGFAALCDHMIDSYHVKIVFVGDRNDQKVARRILKKMTHDAVDLTGRTSLTQLAALLQEAFFVIVNDSAPMHMASYLDRPVLALFGPTNPRQYGPWSSQSHIMRNQELCPACRNSKVKTSHECMQAIKSSDVLKVLKKELRIKGFEGKRDIGIKD